MRIELYDPSQQNVRKTSKRQSETSEGWTPRKNADFCISSRLRSAIYAEDSAERIQQNVCFSQAALLPRLKKLGLKDLQPVREIEELVRTKLNTQSDSMLRSLRLGVLTSHAIINELVKAGLEPMRATGLLIVFGPFRSKHYRTMSEDIKDYWVQQLFRLDTDLDRRWSQSVCLARLLAEKLAQFCIPLSLKDVHADLGYKFKCTTCFPEPTAKASVLVSLDFAVTHLGLPLGGPVPALWVSIRDALRISCRNLNLDAQGALLTEAGLKRSNNSCDSFDSYCFNATLFAQNGRGDEFRMALTKACSSVSAIIREDHPRALPCFFEVFIHLIQSGLCGVTEELLKYVGSLYGVMGRPALVCVYQLLREVKAELLSEAMATAWRYVSNMFDCMLGQHSSLAVSIRLDYIKRVHWLEDYAEEERLLRELWKQLDRTLHPSVPRVLLNLAHNMNKQRRYDDAKSFARNVLELTEKHEQYANKSVERIESQKVIAKSYYAEGSMAEAELSQRRLIEMVESTVGRQHAWFAEFLNVLEIWLRSWGKEMEADTVRREVIELIDGHQ